jgi:short-subunit dehydrogenase
MDFIDQVIWITGASSGLGKEMALEFSRRGGTLALSARRMDLLKQLQAEIINKGGLAECFYCDVLDSSSIEKCRDQILEKFSKIDIAIANAGYGAIGKVDTLKEEEWNRQFGVNVTGLALTARFAIPALKQTKGRLVLIGSVAAFVPNPGVSAYGASKAAVHSIGEALQVELRGTGISCTTIHPGFIESEITRVDNMGIHHPEREDPRPKNLIWPSTKAAKVMVEAIRKRKRVYVFTGHGKIAVFLGKYFPGLLRKMISKSGPN